jgi:NAD(P)-dependent dehydrogenase (short-subunit alcohol dehydrogenase family)
MAGRLEGKTALVTGATSGIGAETARCLARHGASVVLVGRDRNRLAAVRDAVERAGPGRRHKLVRVDLLGDEAAAYVMEQVSQDYTRLDLLVHSAGIFQVKPFEETSASDLDRMWQLHVRTPFLLTQAALPALRGGGVVIFISSISGHIGVAKESGYCATKSATDGLMRALAVELAPQGIRVNGVAPGVTATPMNERFRQDRSWVERVEHAILARRLGDPRDIAETIAFLASDDGAYIYGVMLPVDGGYPISDIQSGLV